MKIKIYSAYEDYEDKVSWWMKLVVLVYVATTGLTINGWMPHYLIPCLIVILLMVMKTGLRIRGRVDYFKLLRVMIMLLVDVLLVNLITAHFSVELTLKQLVFALISMALYTTVHKESTFIDIMKICVFAVSCSCLVAVLQTLNVKWAMDIWEYKFARDTLRSGQVRAMLLNGRGCGFSSYSLNLGFQILQVFPMALGLLFTREPNALGALRGKYWCATSCVLLLAGVLATGQRMALFVVILQLLWFLLVEQKITVKQIAGVVFVIAVSIILVVVYADRIPFLINMISRMERLSFSDGSFTSRLYTWRNVLAEWLNLNPVKWIFGCGYGAINEMRDSMALGSGHNFIISNLVEYGVLGCTLSIAFYVNLFRQLRKTKDRWASICRCSLLGYLFVSLTNDANLLDGDMFHMIILSIVIGYATARKHIEIPSTDLPKRESFQSSKIKEKGIC